MLCAWATRGGSGPCLPVLPWHVSPADDVFGMGALRLSEARPDLPASTIPGQEPGLALPQVSSGCSWAAWAVVGSGGLAVSCLDQTQEGRAHRWQGERVRERDTTEGPQGAQSPLDPVARGTDWAPPRPPEPLARLRIQLCSLLRKGRSSWGRLCPQPDSDRPPATLHLPQASRVSQPRLCPGARQWSPG